MMKCRTLLLIIAILIGGTGFSYAQISVSLPTISAEVGEQINVPISVADLTGQQIISHQTKILFDSNILEITGVSVENTLSADWGEPTVNMENSGEVSIAGYGNSYLENAGTLLNLNFNVIGKPGESCNLTFDNFLFNDDQPTVTTTNGSFEVKLVPITVTVTTNWGGGQVYIDGTAENAPYSATWYEHQEHTISVDEVQNIDADSRYLFNTWSDAGAREHTVKPVSDSIFTANMDQQYQLKINSDYGNPTGAGWYNAGSDATIEVEAEVATESGTRHLFESWNGSGNGAYTGSDNPATVTVNEPLEETVLWQTQYYLTVQSDFGTPEGEGWYNAGAQADFTVDAEVSVENEEKHLFASWEGSGSGAYTGTQRSSSVIMNNAITEIAIWDTQYYLSTAVDPAGGGSITPAAPGEWYPDGEQVEVTATPNSGYGFTNWSGDLSGSDNPETIRLSRAKSVTAHFGEQVQITITTSPVGLNIQADGADYPAPQTFTWISGSSHDIAVESPQDENSTKRYVFESWSDEGAQQHTITVPAAAATYTANFKTQYYLGTAVSPAGTGSVDPAEPGTWQDAGTVVTVTASPAEGYLFNEWSGDLGGSANPVDVTMNQAQSVTANFAGILEITTHSLPDGVLSTYYEEYVETNGGVTPLTWAITGGVLPAGLALEAGSGKISGTPAEYGEFTFTVQVEDSKNSPQQDSQTYTLIIQEYVVLLADNFNDGNYDGWVVVDEGGRYAPSDWTVEDGSVVQRSEIWGGTHDAESPDKPGTNLVWENDSWTDYELTLRMRSTDNHAFGVMFRYRDENNYYLLTMDQKDSYRRVVKKENGNYSTLAEQDFAYDKDTWYDVKITLDEDVIQIDFNGSQIFNLSDAANSSGGIALYSWKNTGSYFDDVEVKEIQSAPLAISTSSLADGTVGENYSATLAATGGTESYEWSVISGNLPGGLSLNSNSGEISGTPNESGTFDFTVRVIDSASPQGEDTQALSLTINPPPALTITTVSLDDGTVNENYNETLTATGGLTPYYWEISNGALPAGLTLDGNSGEISGVPTTTGTFDFTVRITDSATPQGEDSKSFSITIHNVPPVQIITTALPDGNIDTYYSAPVEAKDGTTPYDWTIVGGSLPPGLSLNSGSGEITGTPTSSGTYSFDVEVTDSSSPLTSDTQELSIQISETTTLLSDDFNDGDMNGWTVVDDGGNRGPSDWHVSSGVLNQSSNLYGDPKDGSSPDKPGTYAYQGGDWENYDFTVNLRSDDDDAIGVMFRYQDNSNYYRFAMNQQSKYRRLMKKVNGVDQTIAEDGFEYARCDWYTVQVTLDGDRIQIHLTNADGEKLEIFDLHDSAHPTGGVALYSWNNDKSKFDDVVVTGFSSEPDPLNITTSTLPNGTVGTAYETTLNATGGTSPYSWSITGGNLPDGLSLNSSSGVIFGTPNVAGTYDFTAKVTDSGSPAQEDTQNFTLIIDPAPALQITTESLPDGMAGEAYSATLQAIGGFQPYTWSVISGSLPDGLSLDAGSGEINGTPTIAGTFNFTVKVVDSGNPQKEDTKELSITISNVPPVQITTTALPDGKIQTAYSATVEAKDGTTPYEWTIAGGSLPPGLSLNSNSGEISGTPTGGGTYNFSLKVTDSSNPVTGDTQELSILIDESVSLLEDDFNDGNMDGWTMVDDGGNRGPSDWHVSSGVLNQSSNLYGDPKDGSSPDKPGTYAFQSGDWENYDFTVNLRSDDDDAIGVMFRYQDNSNYYRFAMNQQSKYRRLMKKVNGVDQTIAEDDFEYAKSDWYTLKITVEGDHIQVHLTNEDGKEEAVFDVHDNAHAAGGVALYSWNNDKSNFDDVVVTGFSSEPDSLNITTSTVPNGTVGTAYETTLNATGGTSPYSWSIAGGNLPDGLSLNSSSGVISGTPGTEGTYDFSVKVIDSGSPAQEDTQNFTLTIDPAPALQITTTALPNGVTGTNYDETLTATGGQTPYSWSVSSGTLPDGLSLEESTGKISGTPITPGTEIFKVKVVDSSSPQQQDTQQLEIIITNIPPVKITTTSLPDGMLESAYSATVEAEDGTTPYSWSLANGSLPPGLSLNANSGEISGTPTGTGTFSFDVKVTDSADPQTTDTKSLSIFIDQAVVYLNDNFDDGDFDGWTVKDDGGNRGPSEWKVIDGVVRQTSNIYGDPKEPTSPDKPGTYLYRLGDWENYQMTVNIRSDDDDLIGVMFRYQNNGNYYRLAMNRQEKYRRLMKKVDGNDQTIIEDDFSYAAGAWYQVKIIVCGDHIEIYSKDEDNREELVFDIHDGAIASGGVALYSWYNDDSFYDDVYVESVSASSDPLSITTTALPEGTVNTEYSATLQATGGTQPYSWEISEGSLPAGISLNSSTGELSGTPTETGTSEFAARVTDSSDPQLSDTQELTITIQAGPQLTIITESLKSEMIHEVYQDTLKAENGETPYVWSIMSGNLPDGLSLESSTGAINGTATVAGIFDFTAKVTDGSAPQQEDTKELSIEITERPLLEITNTGLKNGALETPYSDTLFATGGLTPYTWDIRDGALPDGLALNAEDGVISGTPTIGGTFEFTARVIDSAAPADTATKELSITISEMVTYLNEDFEDGNFEGWTVVDEGTQKTPSKWEVYWNALEQTADIYDGDRNREHVEKYGTYAYWHDLSWSDIDARLEIRSDDDDAIGVMFRYRDTDNYYRFSMDKERTYRRLIRKYQGEVTILAEDEFEYVHHKWHQLKIVAMGADIEISYNDEVIFEVSDNSILTGGIALYCWYNNAAKFDNIFVTTPSLAKRRQLIDKKMFVPPAHFTLHQNYPNPFNPETRINYDVPETGSVTVQIFNVLGRHVRTLCQGTREAGYHHEIWDGTDDSGQPVGSGIYIYRISFRFTESNKPPVSETKKMLFMK